MSSIALDRRPAIDGLAVGLMVFLTFSWGVNYVAAKYANLGFSPILVSLLRSAIAAAAVFLWCRFKGIALFERDGTLLPGILAGALFGGEFALVFLALDYTSVARSSLLLNSMPFWVLIGAHFLLDERMTARKWAGLVLAFIGVFLVFSDKLSVPTPDAFKGDVMALAASILWALTTLVIKTSKLRKAGAEKLLLYQLAVSAVMTAPLLLLAGPLVRAPDMFSIGALLFQALYIVAFTYMLWFWLMRRYPAAGLASFAFLTPAFGVLIGGLALNEPLTWRIVAALVLIAVGLIVVNRPVRSAAPA